MSSALFALPEVPVAPRPGGGAQPTVHPRLQLAVVDPLPDLNAAFDFSNVHGVERDATGARWHSVRQYTTQGGRAEDGHIPNPPRPENAYQNPCWFRATDGKFYGVAARHSDLEMFTNNPHCRGGGRLRVNGEAFRVSGASSIVQTPWGGRDGNFEIIVPIEPAGMLHLWVDNGQGLNRNSYWQWNRGRGFGTNPVLGVRLLFSDWGVLELLAWEQTPSGSRLVHYFQPQRGAEWVQAGELPDSERVVGLPGFMQSFFGIDSLGHGNFEVWAPDREGGLVAWWRLGGPPWTWSIYQQPGTWPTQPQLRTIHLEQEWNVRAVGASVMTSPFVAIGETAGPNAIGFGDLILYYRDHGPSGVWTVSHIAGAGDWPLQ